MKNNYTKKQRRMIAAGKRISVLLFAAVMALGFLTGLLFFARPTTSLIEKRDLTAFPAFTFSTFIDGTWFSEISTWYSDTYPGREGLIALDQKMESLYGIQTETQVYGGGEGEEIPVEEETKKAYTRTEMPDNYDISEDVQAQVMEGLLVNDGAAYNGYYFSSEAASNYIDVLNQAAADLEGTTQIYSVLVPNNSALLDEEILNGLGGSNQQQAIEYYYSQYSDLIQPIDTINTLLDHKDEYLYFRTDHHWTQLAAYYVYVNFCEAKGLEPESLEDFETHTYSPFLGSYALELENVQLTPDEVTVYVPNMYNTLYVCMPDDNGETKTDCPNGWWEAPIVSMTDNLDQYNQYMRFIQGDQPFVIIDNPEIEDGSSCVVVKESYGNVFVPFLVDHYDKVYVVDFRYNDGDIVDFCKENEIDDLIIVSNIQIIASSGVAGMYERVLQ